MRKLTFTFFILMLLLIACGTGDGGESEEQKEEPTPTPATAGDAAKGKELFRQTTIGSRAGCVTCHSLEPDTVLVGPSLAGIGDRAASRVSGKSAADYLRESLLDPGAHTVEGYAAGLMPAALADEMTDQQVEDLVTYLLTLK